MSGNDSAWRTMDALNLARSRLQEQAAWIEVLEEVAWPIRIHRAEQRERA